MSTYSDDNWVRPEDENWGSAVRWRLAVTHPAASVALIDQVLAEAQEACADAGLPARELFDDAETYADQVAHERISVEERAAVDMDGIAPGEQLQGVLAALGYIGVALSILLMITQGWVLEVSPWQVALLTAGNLAFAAAVGGVMARQSGQVRRSWVLIVLAAATLGAGTAVATSLSGRPPLGDVFTWVPALAYLALLIGAWNMPESAPRPKSPLEVPSSLPTDLPANFAATLPTDLAADEWFSQLDGLLRGRYFLPRSAAAQYVTEARATWQETAATHPEDEFGSPQVYAVQLLDGSPQPQRARRRVMAWVATVIAVLWIGSTIVYLMSGDEPGDLIWRWFACGLFALVAAHAWWRHLRLMG